MAKILVVNDDLAMQCFMAEILEAAGHKIFTASDGLEALGKIYAESFDLAILDVGLPLINGAGLLDVIRKRSPRTMVVMVTDKADKDSTIESLKNGAYDLIKKPLGKADFEKTVQKALEEGRLMRNSGYIYKDHRRQDKSLMKRGILYAIFDSLLAGFSVYLAFLGQIHLFRMLNQPLYMGQSELIMMSLGLTFCFAFVFVFKRSHRVDLLGSRWELAGQIWKNITGSFLLFAAILFLTSDMNFAAGRIAIGLGYILAILLVLAGRLFAIPAAITRFKREGKKNIVIVGAGQPPARVTRQTRKQPEHRIGIDYIDKEHSVKEGTGPKARVIASREDAEGIVLADDIEELHIAGDALSAVEILNLLDRFRGRKLRVVIMGRTDKPRHRPGIPTTVQ